ncbi:MAG: LysR family transcriptional regulator [Caulobacter sp.]|nr:LysR family transcriptional regulator [Caulobacter sp.]
MTLTQFRYLVAILEAGLNISLAAERVNATQPGLSKQLKLLEEELGFQIFVRKGKSLDRLSPVGEEVVESARLILAEVGSIRALADNHRREASGELRLLTSQTQAQFVLPPALKGLRERYPDVNVRLSLTQDQAVRRLDQGEHDLAIVSAAEDMAPAEFALPLYRWRRVALAPAGHALARLGRPATLADLAEHPLIAYSADTDSSLFKAFETEGLSPQFAYATPDSEVIKTYVRSGLGVGIVAEMALGGTGGDLVRIDVDPLFPACTTWAVLRRDRVLRDYVVDFLTMLAPHLRARDLQRLVRSGYRPAQSLAPTWRALRERPVQPPARPVPAGRVLVGC